MNDPQHIRLSDYHYHLPESRIAQAPLEPRDASKLLFYQRGEIKHQQFRDLPELLPSQSLLVFNNSKVIHARLAFFRKTGARIEILLLQPIDPPTVEQAIHVEGSCTWKCIIGRKKKWKFGEILEKELVHEGKKFLLRAEFVDSDRDWVKLSYVGAKVGLAMVLSLSGELPLPPYLKRKAQPQDEQQYQTVYAKQEGAVAAPTAGLHFSEKVLAELKEKEIHQEFVTLHVSAGTFLPVKTEHVLDHDMHSEQFFLSKISIQQFQQKLGKIMVVGTTSMRVLESLYWIGAGIWKDPKQELAAPSFQVSKKVAYEHTGVLPSAHDALQALLDYMDRKQWNHIQGATSILIMPGFHFRLAQGLITNFHMPNTTLMLLVAAFIGEDWKKVYQTALDKEYRFLSYGDSSFLLPQT